MSLLNVKLVCSVYKHVPLVQFPLAQSESVLQPSPEAIATQTWTLLKEHPVPFVHLSSISSGVQSRALFAWQVSIAPAKSVAATQFPRLPVPVMPSGMMFMFDSPQILDKVLHLSCQSPCPCDVSLQHLTALVAVFDTVTTFPPIELQRPGFPQARVRRFVFSPTTWAVGLFVGSDEGGNVG